MPTIPSTYVIQATCAGVQVSGSPESVAQHCQYVWNSSSNTIWSVYSDMSAGLLRYSSSSGVGYQGFTVVSETCPWPYTLSNHICNLDTPTQSGVLLSQSEYDQLHALLVQSVAPYSYAQGGLIFSSMLIATLSIYFLARNAMVFVEIVKKAARLF